MYLKQQRSCVCRLLVGASKAMAKRWLSTVQVGPFHIEVGATPPLGFNPDGSRHLIPGAVMYTGDLRPTTQCIFPQAAMIMSCVITETTPLPKDVANIVASYDPYRAPVVDHLLQMCEASMGVIDGSSYRISVCAAKDGEYYMWFTYSEVSTIMWCRDLEQNMSQNVLNVYLDLFAAGVLHMNGNGRVYLETGVDRQHMLTNYAGSRHVTRGTKRRRK